MVEASILNATAMIYDTPFEVSFDTYQRIKTRLRGIVATREDGGRYFVKLWDMSFRAEFEHEINKK